jgi:hypothetical protein
MDVFEFGYSQKFIQESVPHNLISGPILTQILFMIVIPPLDILTGYSGTGTRPTHFAGQIAVISQIDVQINRVRFSMSLIARTVQKMVIARTLLIAISKCSLGKDYTFLVRPNSSAGAIQTFFMVAPAANICTRFQYIRSEFSDWRTVKPIGKCNVADIVLLIL